MNDKKYEKKIESQKKLISRQSEQIEDLKFQVESLKLECQKKDELINSVTFLKDDLIQKHSEIDEHKKELKKLIDEVRNMKEILNFEVYKGRWWLIKFLIK